MSVHPNTKALVANIPEELEVSDLEALAEDLLHKDMDPKFLKNLEVVKSFVASKFPENTILDFKKVLMAAIAFSMTGNSSSASKLCNINRAEISTWSKNGTWWPALLEVVKYYKDLEVQAKIRGLIEKGLNRCSELLDNGEDKVVDKEVVRVGLNAKDTTTMISMLSKLTKEVSLPDHKETEKDLKNLATELGDSNG